MAEGTLPELVAGSNAPDFTLPDAEGRNLSLADALRYGPALLVFFKISCPTCQYALPFVQRLAQQLEGKPVTVWGISQDSPEHTALFNQEFGIHLRELFDSEEELYPVSEAYGIAFVPTLFLVERDGVISQTSTGFNKKELEDIAARLAAVAGEETLDPFPPDLEVPLVVPGCGSKN